LSLTFRERADVDYRSPRLGLHLQQIFTEITVPVARVLLQVDLSNHCGYDVLQIALAKWGSS
jgi:hypothetical protein